MRFTLAGIAAGSGAAWLTSSLLRDMVYGVRPTDPLVFAGTAALLAAVALVACAVPALRAMKVDPLAALRAE
jgi:ABC-type antimicrobial peptide transport system permease subunit